MIYIANAFSIQMLNSFWVRVEFRRLPGPEFAVLEAEFKVPVSAIGHPDIAAVVAAQTGWPIEANRQSIKLRPGDKLIVAQYIGPRLPEGATSLPEGATIEWWVADAIEHPADQEE